MKNAKRPQAPPWIRHGDPHLWFSASIAARFYFNKSHRTVLRGCKTGLFAENGIPTYFDGTIWFLRLPELFEAGQVRNNRHSRRVSA